MMNIYAEFDFTMIYIALGAAVIAIIVFLLRKFVPGLSGDEKKQTEEEIAEENINSKLSSIEEEEKVRKATEDEDEE